MLQSIRDRTQGWFAGIIVSILILSFALWGIHSYFTGGGTSDVIAKVNGVEITKHQLALTYERLRRQSQTQFSNVTPEVSGQLEAGLKKQALEALVVAEVLKRASLAQHYLISSNQIDSYLETIPDFRVDGQFSLDRFQKVLSSASLSVSDFLELMKTNLLIEQPRLGIIFTSFALPNEVLQTYALVEQTRNLQYAMLSFDQFPQQDIRITEESIQSYYKQHEETFRIPEQISIAYIQLSTNDLMPKTATSEARQQAEEKLADIKEKLTNLTYEHPETLDTAAKALGLSIKKSALFTYEKGSNDISADPKIRAVAFSNEVLNQQNNSDVIQLTPNTILVLRVDVHKPATLLPLHVVKTQIEQKLKTAEVELKAKALAETVATQLQTQPLSQTTQEYHLKWTNAGLLGRQSNKVDSSILNTAFAMPKPINNKPNFDVAKTSRGYAVVMLTDVKDGNVSTANANHQQYIVFAEQIQNTEGLLEYELYKRSQIQRAKIVIGN